MEKNVFKDFCSSLFKGFTIYIQQRMLICNPCPSCLANGAPSGGSSWRSNQNMERAPLTLSGDASSKRARWRNHSPHSTGWVMNMIFPVSDENKWRSVSIPMVWIFSNACKVCQRCLNKIATYKTSKFCNFFQPFGFPLIHPTGQSSKHGKILHQLKCNKGTIALPSFNGRCVTGWSFSWQRLLIFGGGKLVVSKRRKDGVSPESLPCSCRCLSRFGCRSYQKISK